MAIKFSDGKNNAKLVTLAALAVTQDWPIGVVRQAGKPAQARVATWSLRSGHNCPGARDCHSRVVEQTGENGRLKLSVVDGKHTEFRCFAASDEARQTNVYLSRRANEEILAICAKSANDGAKALCAALPKWATIVRIHVGGDFKTLAYFDAWLRVVEDNPNRLFYAYTKSLPFWVKRLDRVNRLDNLVLTASRGGKHDALISAYGLREAIVVDFETNEQRTQFCEDRGIGESGLTTAEEMGLVVDHDDSSAASPANRANNFALALHGTQPAGTDRAKVSNWNKYNA